MQHPAVSNVPMAPHAITVDDPIGADYPHRKQLKFTEFERQMLNRRLVITRAFGQHNIAFKLRELLDHLGVESAYLKGSTANQWSKSNHSGDIDLQFFPPPGSNLNQPQVLASQLSTFLTRKAAEGPPRFTLHDIRNWMKSIDEKCGDAWQRTLIRLGYPRAGFSNIDLHCSDRIDGINHDTLNASTVMYFNTRKNQLTRLNVWSDNLVDFFEQHKLTWFNPDIENGLGRLCYRATKNGSLALVQPGLFSHFVKNASSSELAQVCLRVLTQNQEQLTTSHQAVAGVWLHILEHMNAQAQAGQETALELANHALTWGRATTLDELCKVLRDEVQTPALLLALSNGFRVVLEHRRKLQEFLGTSPTCCAALQENGQQALQIQVASPENFFRWIYNSKTIQNAPELELKAVFQEYLLHIKTTEENPWAKRAEQLLSYLDAQPGGRLDFAIQQIPERSRSCPSKEAQERLMNALEQFFDKHTLVNALPHLDELSSIAMNAAQIHRIQNMAFKIAHSPQSDTPPELFSNVLLLTLYIGHQHEVGIAILMEHPPILFQPWPDESRAEAMCILQNLSRLSSLVDAHGVPPILKQTLEKRGDKLVLQQRSGKWTYHTATNMLEISKGQVHGHLSSQLKWVRTQTLFNESMEVITVAWPDNAGFQGTYNRETQTLKGLLCNVACTLEPAISEQLATPHAIAESCWSTTLEPTLSLQVEGEFNRDTLEAANSQAETLLALLNGHLQERFHKAKIKIEHVFENGKPRHCSIQALHTSNRPGLALSFDDVEVNPVNTENHPWSHRHWDQFIKSSYLVVNSPYEHTRIELNVPWDHTSRRMSGFGTVTGFGEHTFQWRGLIESEALAPFGTLHLPNSTGSEFLTKPAIRFESDETSDDIQIAFLPLLAEFVGPQLKGNYPFRPVMRTVDGEWPEAGQESFIRFRQGENDFSGYRFADEKALGCLKIHAPSMAPNGLGKIHLTGNFHCVPHNSPLAPTHLKVTENKALVPHGLCEVHTTRHGLTAKHRSVFFAGKEFRFQHITLKDSWRYSSPLESHYFMGLRYKSNPSASPENIHILLNPDDRGPDFMVSMPSDTEGQQIQAYQLTDTTGFQMNLTLKNGTVQIASLVFPCGLRYTGQLQTQGAQHQLAGSGGFGWKGCQVGFRMDARGQITQITKTNDAAAGLLQGIEIPGQVKSPAELLGVLSAGRLDWNKDCAPHLRIRDFDHMKARAVVFGQSSSQQA